MPLGGIFPYDDEEERRRRLMTPGINPNAPRLPDTSTPNRPMLPPPSGIPGGMGMPRTPRPSRGEQVNEARDVYLQGTPGRGKSALKGALQGFLGGGGLAGAVTGGIYGAADPRGLREMEFERKVQPKIMRGFGLEDQERAQARQAEQDALNAQYKTAQIGELESQAYKNRLPPPAPPDMFENASGLGIYNKRTGQVATPAPPPQPRELAPRPVLNDRGEYVDFNAETKAGRKVKAFQKPKASGGGKAKEAPKVVSMTQIRKYMKDTGKSRSDAIADAMRDGYRIAR